jgi:peptidoglycan/LPS O-acetylase OafA/YrhL
MNKANPIINILKFAFASAIVVHHTEQYRSACGIENFWQNPTIISLGKTSIVFFFVLSGFLVTNSIINNDFNIKEFYKKRFLRIAPLYYILVLCSIFIFPNILNISYQANVHQTILYLFFLPNIAIALSPDLLLAHTWFIGTSEQCHAIFVALYQQLKNKTNIITLILSIILCYWILGLVLKIFFQNTFLYIFWHFFNIDCIAIGALFALFKENKISRFFSKRVFFYIAIFTSIFLLISGIIIPYFQNQILAIVFGIIIYNITKKKLTFISDKKLVTFLGNISYSIYLFHPIIIICLINSLGKFARNSIITHSLILLLTFVIATIFYFFIEKRFLYKKRNPMN